MFKFIKQYVETTAGADILGVISLLIFFLFFIALLWYVYQLDKQTVTRISNLPLETNENQPSIN